MPLERGYTTRLAQTLVTSKKRKQHLKEKQGKREREGGRGRNRNSRISHQPQQYNPPHARQRAPHSTAHIPIVPIRAREIRVIRQPIVIRHISHADRNKHRHRHAPRGKHAVQHRADDPMRTHVVVPQQDHIRSAVDQTWDGKREDHGAPRPDGHVGHAAGEGRKDDMDGRDADADEAEYEVDGAAWGGGGEEGRAADGGGGFKVLVLKGDGGESGGDGSGGDKGVVFDVFLFEVPFGDAGRWRHFGGLPLVGVGVFVRSEVLELEDLWSWR